MIKKRLNKAIKVVTVLTMALSAIFTGSMKDVRALAGMSGDRILTQAKTYESWEYNSIGTCTGLVTRVLDDLGIGDSIVGSMVGNTARYTPDQMLANARVSSEAKLIYEGLAAGATSAGLKNGDLVIATAADMGGSFGHVGFAEWQGGQVGWYGANNPTNGVAWQPFTLATRGLPIDYAYDGMIHVFRLAEEIPRATLNLVKVDKETGSRPQGDGTLAGAVYGLYAGKDIVSEGSVMYKKDSLINRITTNAQGKGSLTNLFQGEYYWKEISPSKGYELDPTKYPAIAKTDGSETVVVNTTVLQTVRTGEFEIVKTITDGNNSTIMLNEKGAEFTVVPLADYNAQGKNIQKALEYAKAHRSSKEYAVLVTNKDGMAKSPKMSSAKYIIVQTKKGENGQETDLLKPFGFEVTEVGLNTVVKGTDTNGATLEAGEDGKMHYHINNRPYDAYVKIIKRDLETNKIVSLNDTTFKIKMLDKDGNPVLNYDGKNESISQNEGIKTDGEGNISMKVGFAWFDTFTTNSDNRMAVLGQYQEDGNADKGTVQLPVKLHSGNYRIEEIVAPEGYMNTEPLDFKISASDVTEDVDNDPVVEVIVKNQSVKGQITIEKKGEVLTGITKDKDGNIQFVYESQGIAGMEAVVIADSDILDPADGSVLYEKGAEVETLVTDVNGSVKTSKLPLGDYSIQETKAPAGFVLDKEVHKVSLAYEGQEVALVLNDTAIENERQKIETSITKKDKEDDTLLSGAVFGLYATKDIEAIDGTVLVEAGDLIETGTTNNGKYTFKADLPLNEYEVKELKAPNGYIASDEIIALDGNYQGQDVKLISFDKVFKNEIKKYKVLVNKVDSQTGKNVISKDFEFTRYADKACTKVIDKAVANTKDGNALFDNIHYGITYIKETNAPQGYQLSDEVVKIEVNDDGLFVNDKKYSADENDVYSIVYLNSLLSSSIQKITSVNTGDTTNAALGTLFVGLFMVSGFGIVGTLSLRAKHKKNEKNKE